MIKCLNNETPQVKNKSHRSAVYLSPSQITSLHLLLHHRQKIQRQKS